MPNEVATQEKPATSPSGKYTLIVVAGSDGETDFQSFQITDQEGQIIFSSLDQFRVRDTTFFLWDEEDRVWVYSGSRGTFFWERQDDHTNWEKHTYVQSNIPAPEFLKKARPRWHQR